MTKDSFNLTIHMVSSLDGYIASQDGNVSWYEAASNYEKGTEAEDPVAFLKSIDCFVVGARTYEQALELGWPYGDVPTVVLTHRELSADRDSLSFYSGDLTQLVNEHLKPSYRKVWLVGGASLALDFIRLDLADDIRLSILPILLGDGTRFLDRIGQERGLELKDVSAYKNGMVELWYGVRKGADGS
ncbi:dihydrofolate reductase family protein [Paenibacillus koleovorans]|uniref:dihydrofolate reductase family protein n=1 Tax=Paenibacillus koleovorans TaxID=121608 RepID=UPI001C3F54A1|nr:dihydrofolate reductase family protein [Paenibacillus koleovorans]